MASVSNRDGGSSVKASLIAALRKDLDSGKKATSEDKEDASSKKLDFSRASERATKKEEHRTPKREAKAKTPAASSRKVEVERKGNFEKATPQKSSKAIGRPLFNEKPQRAVTPLVKEKSQREKIKIEKRRKSDFSLEVTPYWPAQPPMERPALPSPEVLAEVVRRRGLSARSLRFIVAGEETEANVNCLRALFALLAGHCSLVTTPAEASALRWSEAQHILEKGIDEVAVGLANVISAAASGKLSPASVHAASRFVHAYNRSYGHNELTDEVIHYVIGVLDMFFHNPSTTEEPYDIIKPISVPPGADQKPTDFSFDETDIHQSSVDVHATPERIVSERYQESLMRSPEMTNTGEFAEYVHQRLTQINNIEAEYKEELPSRLTELPSRPAELPVSREATPLERGEMSLKKAKISEIKRAVEQI
eukprot:TRINITY_DN1663_c0_g1_i1.p1 TRINITY_DN1663_c0_g1~~TRINITY_DN1663_c0_g1_i1.p1  ORF type:complete len:423 (-),score=93.09 TRINITY_DN1663_c0_g1_i1:137-1405(-)